MKKYIYLLLSFCFCLLQIKASPIDIDQARKKAQQFYAEKEIKYVGRKRTNSTAELKLIFKEEKDNEALFYVFSKDETGFVIVSAEDNMSESILGYSYNSRFCPDSIPAVTRYWLDTYVEQISYIRNGKVPSTKKKKVQRESVVPMTTSTWNQSSPYNGKCPTYDDENHCIAGCTPVAFAQLMYYYKWPGRGNGICRLNTTVEGKSVSFEEDFSSTFYQWDKMQDSYDGVSSRVSKAAVATLMYHMGIIGKARWGKESTPAYPDYTAEGLNKYFDYKKYRRLKRESYSTAAWADTIYSELQNERPVVYSGDSRDAGHCFICDGYEDDYFHMNWGWGGRFNGYFLLTALNPDPSDENIYGFYYNHYIYIGIEPSYSQSDIQDGFVLYPDRATIEKYSNTSFLFIKLLSDNLTMNDIIWHSSDESTVIVSQDGKITALKEGEADVFAEVKGKTNTRQTCHIIIISPSLVSPPRASIESGNVSKNEELILTTDEENGLIYYTMDGKSPFSTNENRLLFENNIVLNRDVVIKAQAFDIDGNGSEIESFTYDVKLRTPKASVKSGIVYRGQRVNLTTMDEDVDIYYTTDGTSPTDSAGTRKKFTESFLIDRDMVLKLCAVDEYNISNVETYKYDLQLRPPEASVQSGIVYKGTTVKLSTADKGVDIYYTTDGTSPKEPNGTRQKYRDPIVIDWDMTLTFYTMDEYNESEIRICSYQVPRTIYHLVEGWNWISFAEKMPELRDVTKMLSSGTWKNADEVKNGYYSDSFTEKNKKWVGTLSSNGGFENGSMYMLHSSITQDFVLFHTPETVYATDEISITPYWNYISYLSSINMSVNDALANYEAIDGDIIKSQNGFAVYSSQNGWTGSLDSLKVSHGYMLKRSSSGRWTSFTFPNTMPKKNENATPTPQSHRYAQNMSVIANVVMSDLQDGDELAAVSIDGEIRGHCVLRKDMTCFLTVEGDTLADIYYTIVRNGNIIFRTNQTYTFTPNDVVGTLSKPTIINFKNTKCDNDDLYIKVVNSELFIEVNKLGVNNISALLYDNSGRLISQLLTNVRFEDVGKYKLSLNTISRGTYLIEIVINGKTKQTKQYKFSIR